MTVIPGNRHHAGKPAQPNSAKSAPNSSRTRANQTEYQHHWGYRATRYGTAGSQIKRGSGEALAKGRRAYRADLDQQPIPGASMNDTELAFVRDFYRDVLRGVSSRYLSEQAAPQARWQAPDVILERSALSYNPDDPG